MKSQQNPWIYLCENLILYHLFLFVLQFIAGCLLDQWLFFLDMLVSLCYVIWFWRKNKRLCRRDCRKKNLTALSWHFGKLLLATGILLTGIFPVLYVLYEKEMHSPIPRYFACEIVLECLISIAKLFLLLFLWWLERKHKQRKYKKIKKLFSPFYLLSSLFVVCGIWTQYRNRTDLTFGFQLAVILIYFSLAVPILSEKGKKGKKK